MTSANVGNRGSDGNTYYNVYFIPVPPPQIAWIGDFSPSARHHGDKSGRTRLPRRFHYSNHASSVTA
ncbi:MAG TPA: hypothetical protein IAA99_00425 [Candidatus Avibacteroides faecavium]|nr:hypothetical protein [Candidatus Avibacteroides faecavium]